MWNPVCADAKQLGALAKFLGENMDFGIMQKMALRNITHFVKGYVFEVFATFLRHISLFFCVYR